MDELLMEKEFPKRYIGFSTSFRREAGSYGRDTKGILRVHQFDKVEIESFTTADKGSVEQDFIVAIQEYFMQSLELSHEVMAVCTGDMGGPDYRQIDINTWIPTLTFNHVD
jgi:seryl-tRNA synthetase